MKIFNILRYYIGTYHELHFKYLVCVFHVHLAKSGSIKIIENCYKRNFLNKSLQIFNFLISSFLIKLKIHFIYFLHKSQDLSKFWIKFPLDKLNHFPFITRAFTSFRFCTQLFLLSTRIRDVYNLNKSTKQEEPTSNKYCSTNSTYIMPLECRKKEKRVNWMSFHWQIIYCQGERVRLVFCWYICNEWRRSECENFAESFSS